MNVNAERMTVQMEFRVCLSDLCSKDLRSYLLFLTAPLAQRWFSDGQGQLFILNLILNCSKKQLLWQWAIPILIITNIYLYIFFSFSQASQRFSALTMKTCKSHLILCINKSMKTGHRSKSAVVGCFWLTRYWPRTTQVRSLASYKFRQAFQEQFLSSELEVIPDHCSVWLNPSIRKKI